MKRVLLLILLTGCCSAGTKAETQPVPSPSPAWDARLLKSRGTVMGEIERDPRTVHVLKGSNPPRYTVTTRSGKTLAKERTLDEIRAKDPGLADLVQHAVESAKE